METLAGQKEKPPRCDGIDAVAIGTKWSPDVPKSTILSNRIFPFAVATARTGALIEATYAHQNKAHTGDRSWPKLFTCKTVSENPWEGFVAFSFA